MATVILRGDAPAVVKEMRATPANVEVGDVFTLTCGGKSVSYTAAAATVADVCTGLTPLWNASTVTEHEEITASDETTYIKLLGDTVGAGIDFTVTASATNGGSTDDQGFAMSTAQAAEGPECWDTATNWFGGAVPVDGDDVILENSSVSLKYGFAQSGVTLNSLKQMATFTGELGLPRTRNEGTGTEYVEYRQRELAIGITTGDIGLGDGAGSGRFLLDTGAAQTTLRVWKTGTPADTNLPAFFWKGSHGSNALFVNRGVVGVAYFGGDTATLSTLDVGYVTSSTDSDVSCGSGLTLTTLLQTNGTARIRNSVTTINQNGGSLYCDAGNITTANLRGGTCYYRGVGTITTANLHGGSLDFRQDNQSRTVSQCNVYGAGASIYDPNDTVTWSAGFDVIGTNIGALTLDMPKDKTWTHQPT